MKKISIINAVTKKGSYPIEILIMDLRNNENMRVDAISYLDLVSYHTYRLISLGNPEKGRADHL